MSNFTYNSQTFNFPVDIKNKKEYIKLFIEFYDFITEREKANTVLKFSLKDKEFQSRFYAVNALNRSN
tara:strand:- start:3183 stop:3386 length:204 start_codon:yes stop_codon:yes gene_type:complete